MIAIQDHGTNESSLETLPLFGAIKRRKFLKICCNLIDTNRNLNQDNMESRTKPSFSISVLLWCSLKKTDNLLNMQ